MDPKDIKDAAQQSMQKSTGSNVPAKTVNQEKNLDILKGMLSGNSMKNRLEEILGKRAAGFASSIISIASSNTKFEKVSPKTIISSAMVAATLDLPINPSLGFAYIIPYGESATFQIGYKGLIQLAQRSGMYKLINTAPVYDGDIEYINRFTGEIEFNLKNQPDLSKEPIGYLAYFKMLNGFEKYFYMTTEELQKHALKFSQTYKNDIKYKSNTSKWNDDFNAMASKTVLKLLLSKYGILSIDMQKAITSDQAIIDENGNEKYPDNEIAPDYATETTVQEDVKTVETIVAEEVKAEPNKPEKKIINFKNEVSVTANIRNLNTPQEIKQFKTDYDEELKALQVEDEAAFNKIIEKLDVRNYELTTK